MDMRVASYAGACWYMQDRHHCHVALVAELSLGEALDRCPARDQLVCLANAYLGHAGQILDANE